MRQIALTRQELHQKVWSSPMHQVAAELGISDVGLSKACKRYKIPIPPQGYWLRKESRRRIAPLPDISRLQAWLAWAEGEADRIDPITQGIASVTHDEVSLPADFDSKVRNRWW